MAYQAKESPKTPAASLGLLLPIEADWRELGPRLQRLDGFEAEFRAALVRHGFLAESFQPFFDAWLKLRSQPPVADYSEVAHTVEGMLTGPLALLAN